MIDLKRRQLFADFLEKLANGMGCRTDWEEYAVNHYHDEILESIRRECVRLSIETGDSYFVTGAHHEKLRRWAKELREPRPHTGKESTTLT